jgi:hypothetical protein
MIKIEEFEFVKKFEIGEMATQPEMKVLHGFIVIFSRFPDLCGVEIVKIVICPASVDEEREADTSASRIKTSRSPE